VVEGRSDHPTKLLLDHAVLARSGGEQTLLGVTHDVGQGLLVGRKDHRLSAPVGQCPRHADALRGAEGEVESGDSTGDLRLGCALLGLDLEHRFVALIAFETCRFGADSGAHTFRTRRLLCARGSAELFSGEWGPGPSRASGRGAPRSLGCRFDADSVAQTCEALADESTW